MGVEAQGELDELIVRMGDRDEAAFRRFYDLAAPYMLAFLLRLLRDRFHAEDVLQETMVIVWNKADEYDPGVASARTWITTIARRRALDILRSRKRRDTLLVEEAEDIRTTLGLSDAHESHTPESSATARKLAACFGQLNDEPATCIRHAYLDGMTLSEIAGHLNRSLGTVKSWVRRGMALLQACMRS